MRAPFVEIPSAADRDAILELFDASVPAPFRDLVRDPLMVALRAPTEDERCMVARDRDGGAVTGFSLFGFVGGALGAGRLRAIGVSPLARRRGVGRALVERAVVELERSGARFVIVELPDQPEARFASALFEGCGFVEEARAVDLVRDGVAMRYLVRRLAAMEGPP